MERMLVATSPKKAQVTVLTVIWGLKMHLEPQVSFSFSFSILFFWILIGCNMGAGKTMVLQSQVTQVWLQVLIFRPKATPHP